MRRAFVCLALILITTVPAAAQQDVNFSGYTFTVAGQEARLGERFGQPAMLFRNSAAYIRDIDFENGTIEFDIASTGHRSFVGVAFRVDDSRANYENFYLRPHNSGRFDAMQYTPVFNGISAWQLFPEHNASLDIPTDRWLHVRLEVDGSYLRVYFDGASEPTMVVERLRHGPASGMVAIRAFFPENEPEDFYPTAFANFVVEHRDGDGDFVEVTPPAHESGFITRWSLSPTFQPREARIETLPAAVLAREGWRTVPSDEVGRVNLAVHADTVRRGGERIGVLARAVIESDREQVKQLNFGFSDVGSVFLNGQLLFSADNTYRSRSQRYLGVMTVENDALYLPLRRGSNELVFAITESFGGWGLTARLDDLDGVTWRAAAP